MPARLVLPPCQQNPARPSHPPSPDKPLRILVLGLSRIINKLFDNGTKIPPQDHRVVSPVDFHETGLQLSKMAFRLLCDRDVDLGNPSDFILRHQYNTFRGKYGECLLSEHTRVDKHPLFYNDFC